MDWLRRTRPTPSGNRLKPDAPTPKVPPKPAAPPRWAAFRYAQRQVRTAWGIVSGRLSLLELIQANLVFTVFLVGIGMVYVWNSHQAERQARRVAALERELQDLKTEYTTLNAQLSTARQQSQVALLVDSLGLEPPARPPLKLEVPRE